MQCGEPLPCSGGLNQTSRPGQSSRRLPSCHSTLGGGSSAIGHPVRRHYPRGIVIVRPQQLARHRPPPPDPAPGQLPGRGLSPLEGAAQALLRQRRWREPRRERRQHWLALVVAGLLHVLFVLVIWQQMRPPVIRSVVHLQLDDVLQVRFVARTPNAAAAPPPPAMPTPPKPRALPRPHEPPAKDAMTLQVPTPAAAAAPRLYDEHGQPLLPAAAASAPTPDYVQRLPQGDPRIMQHRSPVTYQATRFEKDWNSNSNAIDSALQKLVDKTTLKKTIRLPGGVRIHCGVSLAMLAGGCGGDPPPPPSAKDGDERLSMAPAKPLGGDAHAPPKPGEEACIAMYRAGKPLAWGCPVDTPSRAVDAELRERAAGTARQP
ncbi:hypothetical protein [Rhodanobacter denitrificans]|uniref:hypothetical protein n=1 Tax=Rhodanobacter denitrificans TaxID=666685 RepID=UPI001F2CF8D5|nr:hypothetical protein [Rhodanobacter denitrificans]UJM85668.1 hypothetical protein LRJ86_12880 [Rhodanobacter denitrificans]